MKKIKKKEIITPIIVLTLITFICTLLVYIIYNITQGVAV